MCVSQSQHAQAQALTFGPPPSRTHAQSASSRGGGRRAASAASAASDGVCPGASQVSQDVLLQDHETRKFEALPEAQRDAAVGAAVRLILFKGGCVVYWGRGFGWGGDRPVVCGGMLCCFHDMRASPLLIHTQTHPHGTAGCRREPVLKKAVNDEVAKAYGKC